MEVYSSSSKRRIDEIFECIDTSIADVCDLVSLEQLVEADDVRRALQYSTPRKSEACKRVFIESSTTTDATFALDFYAAGQLPELGLPATQFTGAVVVLYRVKNNKINKVSQLCHPLSILHVFLS